jgi:hypothetical protein
MGAVALQRFNGTASRPLAVYNWLHMLYVGAGCAILLEPGSWGSLLAENADYEQEGGKVWEAGAFSITLQGTLRAQQSSGKQTDLGCHGGGCCTRMAQ